MAPAYPCKNAMEQMLSEKLGCVFTSGQIIEKAPVNPQFPDPTPHLCDEQEGSLLLHFCLQRHCSLNEVRFIGHFQLVLVFVVSAGKCSVVVILPCP